jgi:hypothetical protein
MTRILQNLNFDLLPVIMNIPSTRQMGDYIPRGARSCLRIEFWIALDL